MFKKEKIDYIYISQAYGEKNDIKCYQENVAGIRTMRVRFVKKSVLRISEKQNVRYLPNRKNWKKYFEHCLKKIVRQYNISDCIISVDGLVAKEFQLENPLFLARKCELMENRKIIMEKLNSEKSTGMENGYRKKFLIVLESEKWNQKELLLLFLEAKNYFEELYIVVKKNGIPVEQVMDILFEEWGIILHQITEDEAKTIMMDGVCFLLQQWTEKIKRYNFYQGYVVAEEEGNMRRFEGSGKLFSGMKYVRNGEMIWYYMAISMFYQDREKYNNFAITSVDIYQVE